MTSAEMSLDDGLVMDTDEDGRHGGAVALFSADRQYRYLLTRTWSRTGPIVAFLMLNPSTADAFVLDPTVTRCVGFAKREGCAGLMVVNLFALRATKPAVMKAHPEPVGAHNDRSILGAAHTADVTVAAWGTHGTHLRRADAVLRLLDGIPLKRLGPPTKGGHPGHPLFLRGDLPLEEHP